MNAELVTQLTDPLIQNQVIVEAGEKREMSNSPRRRSKTDKPAKKREVVPMGSGAIFLPDRKGSSNNAHLHQKPPLAL